MSRLPQYKFRLFVAGTTSNSQQAIANLAVLCRTHLPARHELEVIDVLCHPRRGLAERVFVTPMLIKFSPGAECRIIGTLHDMEKLMLAIGLEWPAA